MKSEPKPEATLNRELLAERINTSVERLLTSCERNDPKRVAYWAGASARHMSELVRECLPLCPKKRII